MTNSTISVIVPIYNVENYLKQCVDSIINQSYKNLEIFLIDDGSTDKSPQICDDYAMKDKRVRVYHKANSGQSGARNMALDLATGSFVAFVDSDDWLHPRMYETLMNCLIDKNVDVACCNFYNVIDGVNEKTEDAFTNNSTLFDNKEDIFTHLFGKEPYIRPEIWNKLYKKEVIGNVRFKDKQIHQDVFFDRMVFSNAKKVMFLDTPLYYYRVNRPGSTNFRPINENRLPFFKEIEQMSTQLRAEGCPLAAAQVERLAMVRAIYFYTHCTSPEVAKQFHIWFVKFFNNNQFSELNNKWNMLLFFFSPFLYKELYKMKHR